MATATTKAGTEEKTVYDDNSSNDEKKGGGGVNVDVKPVEFYDPSKESVWTRLGVNFESFKRAPGTTGGLVNHGDVLGGEDLEKRRAEGPMLQQKMKNRHLQMIAVGGSIGTGLFVGSGGALVIGGPAGLMIAFLLIGIMMIFITQALGELAILYPLSGGYYALAIRFLDPAWGFAMGWNYVLQWMVTLPLEITSAGITVQYWTQSVPIAAWITLFWMVIIILNIFGTLGYAEEEYWSSLLKLIVVSIFLFAAVVFNAGGGPADGRFADYVGGRYWHDPGAFAHGFKGVCGVFVTAAFAFSGTELVGLAATETADPRKTMPSAVKNTFWRVTVIYVLSLLMIGLNIPWTDQNLLGASGSNASPFVLTFKYAGVKGLDSLVNVTICISVLSIGMSCVYAGSRTLLALAETGFAPKIFAYVDKSGRPLPAVISVLIWGALAYVNVASAGPTVFNWLVAISGLSALFTWLSICLAHIRFRRAWIAQGHSLEELPFRAAGGTLGSWFGVILIVLVFIAQFYVALFPIGGNIHDGKKTAQSFFQAYLAAPIVLAFWLGGYLWKREKPKSSHEIDLDTGRKSWLTAEEMNDYRAERRNAPFHIRLFRLLFTN